MSLLGSCTARCDSTQLSELINALLHPDVNERLGSGGEDGGGGQIKANRWFADVNWARLIDCELVSPLLSAVQEHQNALLEEKPPEDLPEGQQTGDWRDEEMWLSEFQS